MNHEQEIGTILIVIAAFLTMLTPVYWCWYQEQNKYTCCAPIIFISCLFITGIIVLILGS